MDPSVSEQTMRRRFHWSETEETFDELPAVIAGDVGSIFELKLPSDGLNEAVRKWMEERQRFIELTAPIEAAAREWFIESSWQNRPW